MADPDPDDGTVAVTRQFLEVVLVGLLTEFHEFGDTHGLVLGIVDGHVGFSHTRQFDEWTTKPCAQ
ncbi:hypothetical protein ACYJ1Y_10840 [Natrialbaceae archaeon A-gly3]